MGNSESQYSIQGQRGNGLIFPGKRKPCSLRFRSAKEDILSPHSWWRGGVGGSGYKSRASGRGCLSQHKGGQPYIPRHYDCVAKGGKAGASGKQQPHSCERSRKVCGLLLSPPENDCCHGNGELREGTGGMPNGHGVNGHLPSPVSTASTGSSVDRNSPRVVIRKDGSLRVEFTNNNRLLVDDSTGPVQLLKFSPKLETSQNHKEDISQCPAPAVQVDAGFRASKGSSLSSEGSWYDAPWGNGVELSDADNTCSSGRTMDSGTAEQRALSNTPPASLSDLYRDPSMSATFPTAMNMSSPFLVVPGTRHRASFTSVLDVPIEEECPGAKQYSSYTLPCRKARPNAEDNVRKDSLKSRMRHFSDWTGSLSRKKRKLQEPRNREAVEYFDSGVDGLTADTSSPSRGSSLLWYPGTAQHSPGRSGSANALHGSDVLRHNIYENFMRELEVDGRVERRGASTETEESSGDSLGSLEQLDQLMEKERGVVRRAGWLSFKPLVTLHKDRKLELVPRRRWKQYWVTLKGCTLLFYETYSRSSSEQDLSPRYALFAEDSVVQSVPEHPKKENVFCLSNSYGDVFLFQASSQTDLENWVTAVHSACASLFARRHGKEDTVRLLRSQTRALLQKIDMDGKMKKMAELQLSIVGDPRNRKAIESQIQQWEQNLEKFNMDLFRMRCYLASLQGGELPNPKSLLATASRPSKMALSRLGIFSVSSFHALVCSRDEAVLRKRCLSTSQKIRSKRGLFASLKGLDNLTKRGREKKPSALQIFEGIGGGEPGHLGPRSSERLDGSANPCSIAPPEGHLWDCSPETTTCVYMPDCQAVAVPVKRDQTAKDVLVLACKAQQLDPILHGLRLKRCVGQEVEVFVPGSCEVLQDLVYESLEIFPLNVLTLCLSRPTSSVDFGFAVTGHVDGYGNSRIFVSEVLPESVAFNEGLRQGDEILVLNETGVATLDLGLMQTLFCKLSLTLTLRRDPSPDGHGPTSLDFHTKDPCPPVPIPNQSQLLDEFLDRHPGSNMSLDVTAVQDVPAGSVGLLVEGGPPLAWGSTQMELHGTGPDTVCQLYQTFQEGPESLMEARKDRARAEQGVPRPCSRHMPATERLRKVIQELVDTEKSYVKDLTCLFEIYLKPLQNETFLTVDEMESLFGSLPEMLDFQKVFLQTLEDRIASSPDFSTLETPVEFKKLLFSLGAPFLYYADHFKLYSGFCANHIKVQKVLERAKTDRAFKEFLEAKNPEKQHSSTLESYLIKPVQRVLKYPLLLRELVSLTDGDSEEHYHLNEALKAMEKVASHINEMQKIYEDYGTVFDQLVAEQNGTEEVTEISMGEFLMHSSVVWLNPFPSLGRMRKDPDLTVFVFKKAVILVCRETNKLKKKMTSGRSAHSHGDLDPFRFRWLIPLSALQVRLGNPAGTEMDCVWELIHTKSELEGRPETVFQLCSSVPECKANTVKVIRSILRENVRRNKDGIVPLRKTVPTTARIGSSRAPWLSKQSGLEIPGHLGTLQRAGQLDSDEGSLSSGSSGLRRASEGQLEPEGRTRNTRHSPSPDGSMKESDILSDEEDLGDAARPRSPTSTVEAQLQRLTVAEDETVPRARTKGAKPDAPEQQPRLMRAHFGVVKRKGGQSMRRSRGALMKMREHSRSLDSQAEPPSMDFNVLLEREFSVQSLTSVVNEDCFYDRAESRESGTIPTL